MQDHIVRAMTKDGFVNAVAISSREITETARRMHKTLPTATAALGRLLAAASMMGNMQKVEDGSITLQIKGGGPLGTLLAVSDAEGNVYKSLYIYDGEQAIELRLMNDNYVNYPLGQIVYVKAQGLSLASYRYMLSLGAAPALEPDGTFPNDTPSEHDFSASGNSNIPTTEMVQQYVYRGELDTITEADVTVVDKDNYKTVLNDDLLGCLIRFEGLRSSYTTVDSNTYPNYLENVNGVYTNKYYQDEGLPITWAYNYDNTKYYGSSLFTYETTPTSLESGSYVVRVSGYARFALKELPADNAMVNITAIYTKYSSRTGGFITYQLLVSSYKDIEEL